MFQTEISSLELIYRGKVRDLYRVDHASLLMIDSDRLSAFDQVYHQPVPGKGKILTALSRFWFKALEDIIPNHIQPIDPLTLVTDREAAFVKDRATVVKRLTPIRLESVVRGYLAGAGWEDYQKTCTVNSIPLRPGIKETEALSEPLWTPSTKIMNGGHDEACSYTDVCAYLGQETTNQIRDISIAIYQRAAAYAEQKGLILVDTKMEFGWDEHMILYLMDELLTPDASRYWLKDVLDVDQKPYSLDKQYIRNYWQKMPYHPSSGPLPDLPEVIMEEFIQRYRKLYAIILGHDLDI